MFHFPGSYSYQGSATVLIKELAINTFINTNIFFDGGVDTDLEILWKNDSSLDLDFVDLMRSKGVRSVTVVIKSQMIIIATFRESYRSLIDNLDRISLNVIKVTSFEVNRNTIFDSGKRYYEISNSSNIILETNWIRTKIYLSNEYCINDWTLESGAKIYCLSRSGFYFRCGRSHITHQESRTTRNNYERTYKFSFIEFIKPIQASDLLATKDYLSSNQGQDEISYSLNHPLLESEIRNCEFLSERACDFLSILSNQELSPVFLEYEFHVNGKSMQGKTIPVISRRKLEQHGKSFSCFNYNLTRDFSFFLENSSLHEKINRGISSLRMSVSTNIANLKLISSCSALEYFYSFWLFEMGGFEELLKFANTPDKKRLYSLKEKGKTPQLSAYIKQFILFLNLEDNIEYINFEEEQQFFLDVRNKLLHGQFTSGCDIKIFEASEISQSLATEVLISIMKILNPFCRDKFYKNLKARKPLLSFNSTPDGWGAIGSAMYHAYDGNCENAYWD